VDGCDVGVNVGEGVAVVLGVLVGVWVGHWVGVWEGVGVAVPVGVEQGVGVAEGVAVGSDVAVKVGIRGLGWTTDTGVGSGVRQALITAAKSNNGKVQDTNRFRRRILSLDGNVSLLCLKSPARQ
jgi:hypothetical protein